jgi:hypothetical protein
VAALLNEHDALAVGSERGVVCAAAVCDDALWREIDEIASVGIAELLIDCEEDRTLRAVLVGMLREADS